MANLFQSAVNMIASNCQDLAVGGVNVTYLYGGNTIPMIATLGYQLLKTTDGNGVTKLERTDRDFIILASYFVLSGNPFRPQQGNVIQLPITAPGYTTGDYRVTAIRGEAPWRYSDPFETLIRIHTKFLERS